MKNLAIAAAKIIPKRMKKDCDFLLAGANTEIKFEINRPEYIDIHTDSSAPDVDHDENSPDTLEMRVDERDVRRINLT